MRKISLIFIFILLLNSCSKEEQVVQKYFSTWSVMTWTINTWESFVGYIDSFESVHLSPKIWWKIVNINYKEGDFVKAWSLVATLDWTEAKTWYNSADDILWTLAKLKTSTSEMFDEQINAMKSKIAQAEVAVSWASSWVTDVNSIWEEQLKTVLTQKTELEIAIENTKLVLSQKESDLYVSAKNAIATSMIIDTNIVVFLDELLWVTDENEDDNNSFENYLWAKNTTLKTTAENALKLIIPKYKNYKTIYEQKVLLWTASNDEVEELLSLWLELNKSLRDLLKITFDVIDSSVVSSSFTQTMINTYKNNISTFQSNIESVIMTVSWEYILWLEWLINNLANFKKEAKSTLDNLDNKLATIEQTYSQYKAQTKWQLTDISTKKALAEENLKEAKAGLESLIKQKESSLNEIEAKINEAEASRNQAWVMIWNSKVYSPISWVVIKKLAEVWQVTWWGMPILIVADPTNLKVVISVWEEVANNLSVWDTAKLELDWLSKQLNWEVFKVLPTRDQITKKVWVEIKLVDDFKDIKIWTYTKVYFSSNWEEWLVIPNNAIVSKFMIPWVYVLEDNKAKFKNIEIFSQNDNFSMIKGLNIWDTLIVDWKENVYDWEELIINL